MVDSGIIGAILTALQPINLYYCFIGTFLGTIIGVLPGLGPAAATAMLLPVTTYLPATGSIIMLAGIYYGAQYGGSTTSILVNIPGEASSIVTCLDGFQMTKQGRAGEALSIAAIGSFIAGTLGTLALSILAPFLADFGLRFGPPEYFWLVVFGLTGVVSLSGASPLKGIMCCAFGMLLTTIGIDPISGLSRGTFGWSRLIGGLDVVPLVMGLFGIAEMIASAEEKAVSIYGGKLGNLLPRGKELARGLAACLRGTIVGFLPGLMPGMIPALTSFWAYDIEKRISKTPERFGRGAIEGVAAPEAANNATSQAGFIPLMCFGIPTSSTLAIMLAALTLHGLTPGPVLFTRDASFAWAVIGSMYVGNTMLLILNLPLVGLWARLSRVPYKILSPLVLGICVVGAYSVRNSLFDVWVCVIFGVIGYLMKKLKWPPIALLLGYILGDILEKSLQQSLQISRGSAIILVEGPISLVIMILTVGLIVFSIFLRKKRGEEFDLSTKEEI